MGGGGGGGGVTPRERGEDGRCISLMGSVLGSGSNSPGSSLVTLLGSSCCVPVQDTKYSHSASLHPGV